MKDFDKNIDSLIDEFYNAGNNSVNAPRDCDEFIERLELMNKALDVPENSSFDFDINISEIILKAENIKEKRRNKREFILFILVSLVILAAFTAAALILGPKSLIIFQISFLTLIPWSLIPISILRLRGGEL